MQIQDWQNKRVAVLGFGQEGQAVTGFLIKHGIKPVLFDQKGWGDWPREQQEKIKSLGLNFIFGPNYLEELRGFETIVRSPGLPLSKLAPFLKNNPNAAVSSQTKIFFELCPAKIIGITGTKGKGTTSALIFEILKAAGKTAYLTGNIGKTQPLDILDSLGPQDLVVYELSSFQLQDLEKSPHAAVVLMVTSEHLDYHQDNQEYLEAKAAITKYQTADDFAVINADYENSKRVGEQGSGRKFYFSRTSFATDCYVKDGRIFLNQEPILGTGSLQLRGAHNYENVCAAFLTATLAGAQKQACAPTAKNFKGLEHRLELAAEKDGVKFYNDSYSTTPETAIAAIKAFSEPEIIILGGSSKNSDFTELGKTVDNAKNIKAVLLIGQEAGRIRQAITKDVKFLEGAKGMPEIFKQIGSVAEAGDVVVLSPACASFDMFENYADRGQQFKQQALQWGKNS